MVTIGYGRAASPNALRVHPQDDVLVALRDLQPGETVRSPSEVLVTRSQVPRGHKLAVASIPAGSVGLGCENNQLSVLLGTAEFDPERVRSFNAQAVSDEVEEGVLALEELGELLARDVRVPRPLSDLVLGLKCGGFDAFSGLTANPLVGPLAPS